jgi:DNA-binding NtrC family response regulator
MAKCSILLIDDNPNILKALGTHFKRLGHVVHTAGSGKEGLALHERKWPDVTVLDVCMPEMSGLEVLEVLRRRGAVVVMLTGEAEIETAVLAMKLGAENFLTKPFDMDHLTATVEKAAEKVILRREIVELKERLRPNMPRLVRHVALVVLLVLASAMVGRMIAGSDSTRNRREVTTVPLNTTGTANSPN